MMQRHIGHIYLTYLQCVFFFKCPLKLLGSELAKLHWLHFCDFSPLYILDESLKDRSQRMHSCIGCICSTFLHCVFSNVSSNCLPERNHSYTGCICSIFLQWGFSNVSSNRLLERMHSHTGCICSTFLQCVFSNESSNRLPGKMHDYTGCIC